MTERDKSKSADSGAYVLNALSDSERADFEANMASSEQLRNEVTELTDTAVLLGLATTPVTPSPELRDSIMSKIATTPQLSRDISPVRELRAVPAQAEEREQDAPPAALGNVTKLSWYRRPASILTAAAAAIVVIIGGFLGAGLIGQNMHAQQQADALAAINSAPDAQHAAATVSTGGHATLVWSAKLGKSAIIVNGLKELPGGKTYEAWYIDPNGTPKPAGLFEESGSRTWRVLDGTMAEGDAVGVTVEPDGGSSKPTTTPIVAIPSA
ncbi:MAG TPA: anti-sigma factor [Galbitalea sp.]